MNVEKSGMQGILGLLMIVAGIIISLIVLADLGAGSGNCPSGQIYQAGVGCIPVQPGQNNPLAALYSGLGLPYAAGMAPAPVSGPTTVAPGSGNSCPKGYLFVSGQCQKLIPTAN